MDKKLKTWCQKQRTLYRNGVISTDKIEKLEAIEGWLWNVYTDVWYNTYIELKTFVETHNCIPPIKKKLGAWCNTQRSNYFKNKLSQDRIKLLESIPIWYWNWKEYHWHNNFNMVYKYVNIENNPIPFHTHDRFGNWIRVQRIRYKENKMSPKEIKLMESLNGWNWGKDDIWGKKYQLLHKYVNIDYNDIPPQSNKLIGVWVSDQRFSYKRNWLSEDKIKLLENINGWYWDIKDEVNKKWYKIAEQLKGLDVSSIKLSDPKFGSWINNTRNDYREGILSQDKIDFLESIDGWLWKIDFDAKWKSVADSLTYENHIKDHKRWCDMQKTRYKNGVLEQDRIDVLNNISWWYWETYLEHIWAIRYAEFIDYAKKHDVQSVYNKFRNWISVQRTYYKKNKLPQDKIQKLESIDIWCWEINKEDKWLNIAKGIKQYVLNNSDFPPYNYPIYGNWIKRQKYNYHINKLSQDRIEFLESINGWDWGKK